MADRLTKESRSRVMGSIRSRGNRATELLLASLLRQHHVRGWKRHLPLPGTPDFPFRKERLVVFVDGCFWHWCPKCTKLPRTHAVYWASKLGRNRTRDKILNGELAGRGWKVLRIWEHELRSPELVLARIARGLTQSRREHGDRSL
jgi:DNA mismatch endonuclease (patch repair protein)